MIAATLVNKMTFKTIMTGMFVNEFLFYLIVTTSSEIFKLIASLKSKLN